MYTQTNQMWRITAPKKVQSPWILSQSADNLSLCVTAAVGVSSEKKERRGTPPLAWKEKSLLGEIFHSRKIPSVHPGRHCTEHAPSTCHPLCHVTFRLPLYEVPHTKDVSLQYIFFSHFYCMLLISVIFYFFFVSEYTPILF